MGPVLWEKGPQLQEGSGGRGRVRYTGSFISQPLALVPGKPLSVAPKTHYKLLFGKQSSRKNWAGTPMHEDT